MIFAINGLQNQNLRQVLTAVLTNIHGKKQNQLNCLSYVEFFFYERVVLGNAMQKFLKTV